MKTAKIIAKIVVAMAAVAGAVYVIATYGNQIVAWCKKLLASLPCCDCKCQCDCEEECKCEGECQCPCNAVVEEAAEEPAAEEAPAEEAAAEEVPAEEAPVEEAPAEEAATEEDFEA